MPKSKLKGSSCLIVIGTEGNAHRLELSGESLRRPAAKKTDAAA
jgi:hypothetical protein